MSGPRAPGRIVTGAELAAMSAQEVDFAIVGTGAGGGAAAAVLAATGAVMWWNRVIRRSVMVRPRKA